MARRERAEAAKDLFATVACNKDPHHCSAPPARVCYRATVITNCLLCAAWEKGIAMKRFTSERRNEQGCELTPAHSNGEEVPQGLSFEGGLAGPRRYSRRQAIGLLGGSLAGASLLSLGLAAPAESAATDFNLPFRNGDHITLEWYSTTFSITNFPATKPPEPPGRYFLDGRTGNGSVGLAPNTDPPFTGTRWEVVQRNPGTWPPSWWLKCLGDVPGPQWLDGRTGNGTVGLAPTRSAPYTGTRWEIARWTGSQYPPNLVFFKCLGDAPGPRWLTGYPFRSANGTVGLSDNYSTWTATKLLQ